MEITKERDNDLANRLILYNLKKREKKIGKKIRSLRDT